MQKEFQENITKHLIEDLIADQFPQWSNLEIEDVEVNGMDNRTFRLGSDMLVRLPSEEKYASQIFKEHRWLPMLAGGLSVKISTPIAMGKPSKIYPWHWSVYDWIHGQNPKYNFDQLPLELANFLNELQKISTTDAPTPGYHNHYRGAQLSVYDNDIREAISALRHIVDLDFAAILMIWEKAISSKWENNPVWIHGDLSTGNIVVNEDRLVGVIDFGCMGVGDPACDLVMAWTFFNEKNRIIFRSKLDCYTDTIWQRAMGWCLWKALRDMADYPMSTIKNMSIINEVFKDAVALAID
jgi:aminoglycoside phosphotransferase (APT) family kinase protein